MEKEDCDGERRTWRDKGTSQERDKARVIMLVACRVWTRISVFSTLKRSALEFENVSKKKKKKKKRMLWQF